MISGMAMGKNMVAENKGYCKNKSNVGIWTKQLEEQPKRSITEGYRGKKVTGKDPGKSLKSIMQNKIRRIYNE